MAESTLLLDENQWLDGRTLALEGEIKGVREPTAELETH
jgi:FKBP-type peptidyl-prolyl cis-trans isomerase 2